MCGCHGGEQEFDEEVGYEHHAHPVLEFHVEGIVYEVDFVVYINRDEHDKSYGEDEDNPSQSGEDDAAYIVVALRGEKCLDMGRYVADW